MPPFIHRASVGLPVLILIAIGAAAPSSGTTVTEEKPDKPERQTILLTSDKLTEVDTSLTDQVYRTRLIETDAFDIAALTWDGTAVTSELEFSVRSRSGRGWSDWYELHDDSHGPDPGSEEAKNARSGTEPLIATDSDAVQVRMTTNGPTPEGLQIDLINSDTTARDTDVIGGTIGLESVSNESIRPTIYSRSAWGADESIREPGNPNYGEIRGGFVHHTAGRNSYSQSEVPGIIRSIYRYHVETRGWRDIGYNFLVDRFGRIWEGRYGGMGRPVVGAHVSGYNSNSVGVSALGTYTNTELSSDLLTAFEKLLAWKFTLHGVIPTEQVSYPGRSTLPTIAGHRDGGSTECPGDRLYAKLGGIRTGVEERVQLSPPLINAGDFDSDGKVDMLARTYDGTMWLFPGSGDGAFQPRAQIGHSNSWNPYDGFVGIGDINNDGNTDLIARHKDGTMWLSRGQGDGGFRKRIQIATHTAWNDYTAVVGIGDINNDGNTDLIARHKDGTMWLSRGQGDGRFRKRIQIGAGVPWNEYVGLVGVGDFDSDGAVDLLARHHDGPLWMFPGTGTSNLEPRQQVGTSTSWHEYG